MNTQKNVNQRLSKLYSKDTKQELSSEKVELSSIRELERLGQDVKQITDFFEKELSNFEKAKMDLKQSIKGRTNQSIDLVSAISDASKKAEDLGVDIDVSKYERILDNYYKIVDKVDVLLR